MLLTNKIFCAKVFIGFKKYNTMSKHTSPEQFLGQSPVSADLLEKFRLNLASGALRIVEVK